MNETNRTPSGLIQVLVIDEDGLEGGINVKLSMEAALVQASEINLIHASTTPCMISPLKEIIGPCIIWNIAKDLLLGKIQSLEWIEEETMEVLMCVALKREQNIIINQHQSYLNSARVGKLRIRREHYLQ